MRMIDKKIISSGNFYEVEEFLINKTVIDKENKRLIKIMTGYSRIDCALKKSILMYADLSVEKDKNIVEQINIKPKNFDIYNRMKEENIDKKIYYNFKLPKWCILIALNSINPSNHDEFIRLISEKFIDIMNGFIPVEVDCEKDNRKNNK